MKAPQAHGSRSKISALGLTLALISGSASAYYLCFRGQPDGSKYLEYASSTG